MKSSLLMLPLLVVGAVPGCSGKQPDKAEKDDLKGEWMLVSNESSGFIAEIFGQVPELDKVKIATFSGDRWKLEVDGEPTLVGAYHVDPTKAPKMLDLAIEFREGRKATIQGIYESDGDHLKMCFDHFGAARPTEFPVKNSDGPRKASVLALRRVGADPKQDALDENKAKCAANLATIADIMDMYVLEKRAYPPAAIYSKDGKPLLSWRVALSERLGQGELFKEFRIDEPWDSAHNTQLISKMPKTYALPGVETKEPGMTFFQVFTGKGTLFEGKEGLKFPDPKDRGDGIVIVEAGEPVVWTKPDDLVYDPKKPLPKLGRLTSEGFHAVVTSSGPDKLRFIPNSTPEKKLRSMIQWRIDEQKEY